MRSWVVLGYLESLEVVFTQVLADSAVEAGEKARAEFKEEGWDHVHLKYVGYGTLRGENQYVANPNMEQVGLRNAVAGQPELEG